ncbi:hypothetical protein MMC25_007190 [Agyrium rufum]|nr:hypothetical protein [Agyrium rufum]
MSPKVTLAPSQHRDDPDDGSDDGYDHEEVPMIEKDSSPHSRKWGRGAPRTAIVILGLLLLASLLCNAILLSWSLLQAQDLDALCVKHTSEYWSPITDSIKIRFESVLFDGSFMTKSIYQQSAGPEVDEAWSGLGIDFRTAVVPENRGLEAGLDPSAVKARKSQGGGYLTNVENMIRQTLPWNVDYYRDRGAGVYENSEPIVELHVVHCLDIIRQQLQCSSDVGMFGQRWIRRKGKDMNVFPIFDTVHKCRNFNDVLAWAKEHKAPDGLVAEVRNDDVILDAYP